MNPREGSIIIHDTGVHVWEEHVDEKGMLLILYAVREHLEARRFDVGDDAHISNHFPSLNRFHFEGRKGPVHVKGRLNGRHLSAEFFQEFVVENKAGGSFNHQKLAKATKAGLRMHFLAEIICLVRWLMGFGYVLRDLTRAAIPFSHVAIRDIATGTHRTPLDAFNAAWTADRFRRDESGWPADSEVSKCNWCFDRDGNRLTQGATKYLRVAGRLVRGQVFGGINGQWRFVSGGECVAYLYNTETRQLFDCERPDLEPRRHFPDQQKHLERELKKAIKGKDYRRVASLGKALARMQGGAV